MTTENESQKADGLDEREIAAASRPWSEYHKDYRSLIDGKRYVMILARRGTALVPWLGGKR